MNFSAEEIQALLESAIERAATEVVTWIPEKPGDRIAGKVIEIGTIHTKFGDYFTTTIEVRGNVTGLFPSGSLENSGEFDGKLVRVAWMGAVLVSTFLRLVPDADDLVAFHYQSDVTPQNGMNDYALVVAVVIDGTTGKSKRPNLAIPQITVDQIRNADPQTGELPPSSVSPDVSAIKEEQKRTVKDGPLPGEKPL
jgi:hypothetical protein